ncbi:hypothetical protein Bca101_060792 [Brassica carinata]
MGPSGRDGAVVAGHRPGGSVSILARMVGRGEILLGLGVESFRLRILGLMVNL